MTTLDTTKLDALISRTPGRVAAIVGKAAFRILGEARMNAPRDPNRPPNDPERQVTGALKANSDVVKIGNGLTQNVEFYQEYAVYQELGAPAINLPARPYLTPAVEKFAEQFSKDLEQAINDQSN